MNSLSHSHGHISLQTERLLSLGKTFKKRVHHSMIILFLSMLLIPDSHASSAFYKAYSDSQCDRYEAVSIGQLTQAKKLFLYAFKGQELDSPMYKEEWRKLGFQWFSVVHKDALWWLAQEPSDTCRGQGFYAFQVSPISHHLLQIPHRFKDQSTGRIGRHWMGITGFSYLAWNTTKRSTMDNSNSLKADLAHRDDSFFTALTHAFAAHFPTSNLNQLHGFSSKKRKSNAARMASIIISSGHKWPSAAAIASYRCLSKHLSESVLLFPKDVQELGATQNSQGKLLRRLGLTRFVHIELSNEFRGKLLDDKDLSKMVVSCVSDNEAS